MILHFNNSWFTTVLFKFCETMQQDRKQRYPPLGSLVSVRYRLVLQLPAPELSSRIVWNPCVEGRTVCKGAFRNQFCLVNFDLNLYCICHFSRQLNLIFRYASFMLLWFYERLHIKVLIRYYFFIYAKLSFPCFWLRNIFHVKVSVYFQNMKDFSSQMYIVNIFSQFLSIIYVKINKLIRTICLDWTRIWNSSQRFEILSNRNPVIDHD